VTKYGGGAVDPDLKTVCRAATTAGQVFDKLATFTNSNFFTAQTISGAGGFAVTPVIDDRPAYPAPRLEQLSYNGSDYTYYKTLPGGQTVKMCKDEGFFLQRCYPYIDAECVESQAAALMPNIIEAGANVIRLFIPKITVTVTSAKADGTVSGTVAMAQSPEYATTAIPAGIVRFYVNNGEVGSGMLKANGSFEVNDVSIKEKDEVVAEYRVGGLYYRSEPLTVGDDGFLTKLKSSQAVLIDMSARQTWSDGSSQDATVGIGYQYYDPSAGITPLSWSGNSFTFSCDYSYDDQLGTNRTQWTVTGTVSSDGRTIVEVTGEGTYKSSNGQTSHEKLRLANVPFIKNYPFAGSDDMDFGNWDRAVRNYFVSYEANGYVSDGQGGYKPATYVSTDWDYAGSDPWIFVQFFE
jgi:hypothetical protein